MKTLFKSLLTVALIIFLFFWYFIKPRVDQNLQTQTQSYGLHYGINQTTEFFDKAYANQNIQKPNDKIAGITVNHHLLAPNLIAKEFNLVATDKPITVILLSPNHFYRGDGGAITSKYDWQTPYGILKTNQALVNKLQQTGLVNVDESPFGNEHGINGIVGFIKKSLPNASFVPLIIKDNLPDNVTDQLAVKLKSLLPQDTLIVGSLDFSHYLPSNGAQFHDVATLAAMRNFDYDRIKKLDIDSHSGLRLLLKYFDVTGNKKFVLTSHENSSTITGNYSFVETTSYLNGYFTSGTSQHDSAKTVLYVQGLSAADKWQVDASDRLYKYNDQLVTEKPHELDFLNLGEKPIAVGMVYNPGLSDIYLFPLNISNHIITLQAQPNPDIMHIRLK